MIITGLFLIFANAVDWIMGLLPNVDATVITKMETVIDFVYNNFMTLAYYYLPMTEIAWWIEKTIGYMLAIIALKVVGNLAQTLSGGVIKAPWAR